MGWLSRVTLLVVLRYISLSGGVPHFRPIAQGGFIEENAISSDVNSNVDSLSEVNVDSLSQDDDSKLQQLANYLTYVLLRPWPISGLPLLYVENYPAGLESQEQNQDMSALDENGNADGEPMSQLLYKRSRYYRKYPWKRQNSRETYEAENRYLCQPSKDDVFRLLVALHEARQGNRGHTIHFCNRKRPASAIFTNIRFLGKRK